MSVAAIVLAAGASRRLGQPKQLVQVYGETLLERTVRVAREAGCEPVIVVLGANADKVLAGSSLEGAQVVMNELWEEGMASSIRAGVASLRGGIRGCVLMTCDMPTVSADHLRLLRASSHSVTASLYEGRSGVPAYFAAEIFPALLALHGDVGARDPLREAPARELVGGEVDIDTPEDLPFLAEQPPQA